MSEILNRICFSPAADFYSDFVTTRLRIDRLVMTGWMNKFVQKDKNIAMI